MKPVGSPSSSRNLLFDAYLMVNWSASSRPTRPGEKDTIWWCLGTREEGSLIVREPENACTRTEAEKRLRIESGGLVRQRQRVLIGFDFSYGYPAGLANCLGLDGIPGSSVWDELARQKIRDEDENSNNRFEVASELNERIPGSAAPFWGCPATRACPFLGPKRPVLPDGLRSHRIKESRLRGPKSTWQLYGAGSVGSQALLGIPRLRALVEDPALRPICHVWPSETGFGVPEYTVGTAAIIHAEIHPSLVKPELRPGEVLDAAQVRTLVTKSAGEDDAGRLGGFFEKPDLEPDDLRLVLRQEGWILGYR